MSVERHKRFQLQNACVSFWKCTATPTSATIDSLCIIGFLQIHATALKPRPQAPCLHCHPHLHDHVLSSLRHSSSVPPPAVQTKGKPNNIPKNGQPHLVHLTTLPKVCVTTFSSLQSIQQIISHTCWQVYQHRKWLQGL